MKKYTSLETKDVLHNLPVYRVVEGLTTYDNLQRLFTYLHGQGVGRGDTLVINSPAGPVTIQIGTPK